MSAIIIFLIFSLFAILAFRYDYKLNYRSMKDKEIPVNQVKFTNIRNIIQEECEQRAEYYEF